MPISHFFFAILVTAIWGFNFIFVKYALDDLTPWALCSARFLLASIPAIFFIKPPAAPIRTIVSYGIIMFGLQFLLLFMSMKAGMAPGLASLLAQIQVFFSIFFAAIALKEIPTRWQILGALVSFSGLGVVGLHLHGSTTVLGFVLIIAGTASWGIGNLITRKLSGVNAMSLVVWGSFVAALPMLALALVLDGPTQFVASFIHISLLSGMSVLYIVFLSTWVGYGLWNFLISRYPIATVVPFTLLVPFFGMLSAVIFVGEPLQAWKLGSGCLIVGGLAINLVAARFLTQKNDLLEKV